MKHLEQESRKGPKGKAQVNTINSTITVQFLDDWGQPAGRMFPFSTADFPQPIVDGVYAVGLSADADKIYSISPLNATVVARFSHIVAKEGQLPAPKHVTGTRSKKDGTTYPVDEMTFTVVAKIESPEQYKGMEFILSCLFSRKGAGFCDDGNGNLAYRGGGDKGDRWIAFMDAAGIGGRIFPYDSNPLPALEAAMKEVDKPFMAILQNGWPTAFGDVMGTPTAAPKLNVPTMTDEEAREWLAQKRAAVSSPVAEPELVPYPSQPTVARAPKPSMAQRPSSVTKPSPKPNGNGKSAHSSKTTSKKR
jgi:hypothetical protein